MELSQEDKESKFSVISIPGYNGHGITREYISKLLDHNNFKFIKSETPPELLADLGQIFCQLYFNRALRKNDLEKIGKPIIFYGSSQGTATILNHFQKENNHSVAAIILESVVASGNLCIEHITGLSKAYYFLPYMIKLAGWLPLYNPAGPQPIKSKNHLMISDNVPIVIIHSEGDVETPLSGAKALYHKLKYIDKHENTYLIIKNGDRHLFLLNEDSEERSVVKNILTQHRFFGDNKIKDLNSYQPDSEIYKDLYDKLIIKERNHEIIGIVIIALEVFVVCVFLGKFFNLTHNKTLMKNFLLFLILSLISINTFSMNNINNNIINSLIKTHVPDTGAPDHVLQNPINAKEAGGIDVTEASASE